MSRPKPKKVLICPYCKEPMPSGRRADMLYCGKAECRNAKSRDLYLARSSKKACRLCFRPFQGRDKQIDCPECAKKRYERVKFRTYVQESRCRHCGLLLRADMKYITAAPQPIRRVEVCGPCHSKSSAASKFGPKNPNWKGGKKKARMTKDEVSRSFSRRMKRSNPMKNAETKRKMSETLKKRHKLGWIRFPTGPAHWLWKGNREPSFVIRARIKPWVKDVLKRDQFRCILCGKKRGLEVHHLRSFKDIVEEERIRLGLGRLSTLDVSSEDFQRLCQAVFEAHRLSDGETLCDECHSKKDKARRIGS